jgi:tight adherence protein B
MEPQDIYRLLFYAAAAAAAIFFAEAFWLALSSAVARRRGIDRRIREFDDGLSGEEVLVQLRRERGIAISGRQAFLDGLAKLLVQSGLRLTAPQFILLMAALVLAIAGSCYFFSAIGWRFAALLGVFLGIGGPIFALLAMRARRQSVFVSQLPNAMDVIVRSLRSGHPVPVAMAMVGREIGGPIGSEFSITVDEMTYGLDTERALRNMYDRVGSPELSLLVTAISLQMATGGNLAEILGNLTKIIRDRFQLRRKVRALSAEGRISAYALSVFPVIMFIVIDMRNESYYGDVWNEPIFLPALILLSIWAFIGDIIMFKMINFKY